MRDMQITLISAITAAGLYFLISLLPERVKIIVMLVFCGTGFGFCLYPIVTMGATDPRLKLGVFFCALGIISWILVLIRNIKGGKHGRR
jgi:hypothetical protein